MEFLTTAAISVPDYLDSKILTILIDDERARARQLADSGELVRAWRTPGTWGNWCLWREPDLAALKTALESLPLFPFIVVTIHPLEPHPNDPGPT